MGNYRGEVWQNFSKGTWWVRLYRGDKLLEELPATTVREAKALIAEKFDKIKLWDEF
jgi:hypothetical protein